MPLFLTSTGFFYEKVKRAFTELVGADIKTAAIVTTASPLKEKNRHARAAKKNFQDIGFRTVDFLDIEFEEADKLAGYDCLFLNGGNPFQLLKHLRNSGADPVLKNMLKEEKVIVGSSAGAMVLGSGIGIAAHFTPKMNTSKLADLKGLELLEQEVFPHYGREDLFRNENRQSIEERIRDYELETDKKVTRLGEDSFIKLN